MKQIICVVKDRAADCFGRLICVPAVGVAIRHFSDEINRNSDDNSYYHHADDFDLYELGEFDDNTGKFTLLLSPKMISLGKQVKIPVQAPVKS